MRLLVSGAYGFVGTNLSRFLAERGHECVALDLERRDSGAYSDFVSWDGLDRVDWASFDAVVHLAGKAHDTRKTADPQSYFDVNVGLTQRLFSACDGRAGTFVYFSSIKAVDGDTPYARSKREAERWLDGRAVVLEPAMIHGPGNKGNLNLLFAVARRGLPWPLAAFENRRSFTSVANACAVVERICLGGVPNGIYPLCDDEPVGTNRLIELIAEAAGRKARLWRVPRPLVRFMARVGDCLRLPLDSERLGKLTGDSVVDNSAIKAALGWDRMPVRAEDGLRETLKWFSREAAGKRMRKGEGNVPFSQANI